MQTLSLPKKIYVKNLIGKFALRTFCGSKFTGPVHNKDFQLNQDEPRTSPGSCKKFHDAIMQISLTDKYHHNEYCRRDLDRNRNYSESE